MSEITSPDKILVIEETAAVEKQKHITARVHVKTNTQEEIITVDEPLITQHVTIERVPIDRWIDHPVPVRQEGETTVISVIEEVAVVQKRLKLVEEVRNTKQQAIRHEHQSVTLRRQNVVVERVAEPEGINSD